MSRKMPEQKPGKSEQVVRTPFEFIDAVVNMFDGISVDLAALASNAHTQNYFGPDHVDESRRDSLIAKWPRGTSCWLNPPYANIARWVEKCAAHVATSTPHTEIFVLVPASVGANWYRDHVQPFADVYSVGRMKFVGHEDVYPKDLILAHYWKPGGYKFRHWKWQ